MALPQNTISPVPNISAFLSPDIDDVFQTESLELGGIAVNDSSQGRQVQVWRAFIASGTTINISPISGSPVTTLVTGGTNITGVSLAFDSNMQPVISYTENGAVKLRFFNVNSAAFQTDTIAGATSHRVTTDDKRPGLEPLSDVLFFYTRSDTVYYRQQRDRYTVERFIGAANGSLIARVGMNSTNRMQIELRSVIGS